MCDESEFRRIDHAGPAIPFTLSSSNGTREGIATDRVGTFHLAEERKHHDRSALVSQIEYARGAQPVSHSHSMGIHIDDIVREPTIVRTGAGEDAAAAATYRGVGGEPGDLAGPGPGPLEARATVRTRRPKTGRRRSTKPCFRGGHRWCVCRLGSTKHSAAGGAAALAEIR